MKRVFFFLAAAAVGLAFTACDDNDSSDVHSNIPFYQDYRTEFDLTKNQTIAQATFREKDSNGDFLKLTGYSKILFGTQEPNYTGVRPFYYNYTFQGTADVKYVFTREPGRVYTNVASLGNVEPIGIPTGFTTVATNGSTVLTWTGGPLLAQETVEASVVSSVGGNNGFKQNVQGSTTIGLPINSDIPAGVARLTLSRVKTTPLQQSDGTAGGELILVYTVSKDITVQ